MKNKIFTIAALSLCLLTVPSWAMDDDSKVSLNKATRLPVDPVAAPAVATVEDADDDSSSSSSSDSSSSDSDAGQTQNRKSKTFFIHIANQAAARIYAHILGAHNFSVSEHRREHVRCLDIATAEEFLNEGRSVRRLCRNMKSALKRFGATQELIQASGERFIKLTTREEQPVKEVVDHLKKSVFVYKVFSDEANWNEYCAETSSAARSSKDELVAKLLATGKFKMFDPAQGAEQFFGATRPSAAAAASSSAQTDSTAQTEARGSAERDGATSSSSTANHPSAASESSSSSSGDDLASALRAALNLGEEPSLTERGATDAPSLSEIVRSMLQVDVWGK